MAKATAKTEKKTSIGGQALIEGVMMRGPEKTAMAVRHVSGEIVMESWQTSRKKRPAILKWPLIRGVVNFVESMYFGYKCLMRSAEMSGLEEEEPVKAEAAAPEETTNDTSTEETTAADAETPAADAETPAPKEKSGEKILMGVLMVFGSVLGVALAICLFLWLPSFLFAQLGRVVPALGEEAAGYRVYRGIFEGVFRIILFLVYMILISQMKDIRRVFQYHGAEHKTIFCYEHGKELTVENVRQERRFHPRCGTSFMILMLLLGVIVSIFIWVNDPLLRTGIKLLTIPLVVGIGYELIKLAGRKTNWFTRAISAPGIWIQRITTKEPDDSMIECAIRALQEVIPEDPETDNW